MKIQKRTISQLFLPVESGRAVTLADILGGEYEASSTDLQPEWDGFSIKRGAISLIQLSSVSTWNNQSMKWK